MNKFKFVFYLFIVILLIQQCYYHEASKIAVIETYRFDEPLIDSVKIGYALPTFAKNIWSVKGYVDDTIVILLLNERKIKGKAKRFFFSGNIKFEGFEDTTSFDWNYIVIEPYKAKKGFIRAERRIEP